jgi:hypothetical protein
MPVLPLPPFRLVPAVGAALALWLAGCGETPGGSSCAGPSSTAAALHGLPLELLPRGARVIAARRTGSAVAGAILFHQEAGAAQSQMALDFSLAGYRIVRGGDRGFEAELWVRRGGEEIRFKFFPSRRCPGYTQGSFTRIT